MRKVGDKVTINPYLKVGMGTNDENYVVEDMFTYTSISTEITKVLDNGETYQVACDGGEWYWPDEALLPMSNAEKIQHMTNEELTDFILSSASKCMRCKRNHHSKCINAEWNCRDGVLEWLKSDS